ncbi:NAD-dependent epimerase/dehydratase family protein [Alicyclobacillus curvatus]|nr:NAD-dependent epimerase/dehydratase family protein [Alicyclobacillus curvatus]
MSRVLPEQHIMDHDLNYIVSCLTDREVEKFNGATVVVTGCAGFIGYYVLHFFDRYAHQLGINKVVGLDNFTLGQQAWVRELGESSKVVEIHDFDVIRGSLDDVIPNASPYFVVHMASIASPPFYRRYPLETVDANVWGLRRLLEHSIGRDLRGFLFFSSSEIYGEPDPLFIPTAESYWGNVSSLGPRACYDESKRFGETLCEIFAHQYGLPITIVRPFNNFGPGTNLDDQRVTADFTKAIVLGKNVIIHSDGTPTRTFCYVADAVAGYLKALLYGTFDCFNIGTENPEISMKGLAELYVQAGKDMFKYEGQIEFIPSSDPHYLTHNPSRRCPDISKAKNLLSFRPKISLTEGIYRELQFFKERGSD